MEGASLWCSVSRAVANAWCFSLRLGLGAGGPQKHEAVVVRFFCLSGLIYKLSREVSLGFSVSVMS